MEHIQEKIYLDEPRQSSYITGYNDNTPYGPIKVVDLYQSDRTKKPHTCNMTALKLDESWTASIVSKKD